MTGVIGIITFLTVLGLSLIITRLATIALKLTGLSQEVARFQGRSAFTGTGFTTSEAEKIVTHPVRRKIIMWLMIIRSAGLITIIISLILSFVATGTEISRLYRLLWLLGGVLVLWGLANCNAVDRCVNPFIEWALRRWTDVDTRDYANLLNLSGEYSVMEIQVQEGEWMADKTLQKMSLVDEGVLLLGINREQGEYVGVPRGNTKIYAGDTLILYGRTNALRKLDKRRADLTGEYARQEAIEEQQRQMVEQDLQEQQHEAERQGRQPRRS